MDDTTFITSQKMASMSTSTNCQVTRPSSVSDVSGSHSRDRLFMTEGSGGNVNLLALLHSRIHDLGVEHLLLRSFADFEDVAIDPNRTSEWAFGEVPSLVDDSAWAFR